MKSEDVEFEYINGNFVIIDTKTKKIILKIKCPLEIYEKIKLFQME
jgi:hypothetical protein